MNIVQALQSIQNSLSVLTSDWILISTFFICFFLDVFFKKVQWIKVISLVGMLCSLFVLFQQSDSTFSLFSGYYQLNAYVLIFKKIIILAGILSFLPFFVLSTKNQKAEFYYMFPLLILSSNLLSMSNHFLSIFIGIEFLSILTYLYIAYEIRNRFNAEASSKYILFGAFASAVMLYGITWIYSLTGTLYLNAAFLSALSKAPVGLVTISLVLFSVGFLFKLSAAPFHYYTPDVYEGSAPSTLSFISVLPKIAGFAILFTFIRHFQFDYQGTLLLWPNFPWEKMISILAIATLFIGNLSALSQKNLKRIFAYSSISHTGFLLLGILSLSNGGFESMIYYLIVYAISSIAVFSLLDYWEQNDGVTELKHLVGFSKLKPFSSILMIVLLASFVGLPPLAGFTAKFYLFSTVFEQLQISFSPFLLYALIAGVLNTVIALFYYFNIARHLYLVKSDIEVEIKTADWKYKTLLGFICFLSAALLLFGIMPGLLHLGQ